MSAEEFGKATAFGQEVDISASHIGSIPCKAKACKGLKPHKVGAQICRHPLFGNKEDKDEHED